MMRGGGSRVEGIWEITKRSFEKIWKSTTEEVYENKHLIEGNLNGVTILWGRQCSNYVSYVTKSNLQCQGLYLIDSWNKVSLQILFQTITGCCLIYRLFSAI